VGHRLARVRRADKTMPIRRKTKSKMAPCSSTLAREMIARTQADPTLMGLLFFSALEGHFLSDMFFHRNCFARSHRRI
jgi:hypothetical protein